MCELSFGQTNIQVALRVGSDRDIRLRLSLTIIQGKHKRIARFKKLTRNLFLTLYGHNVHCQQRQLSMFLMRYQKFASHAYCGAAWPVSKMASQQEKAFCVLRFEVSRSDYSAA